MGFSVSGTTALIFVAFLISFGAFYSASMGTFGEIRDAQVDQSDRNIDTINTDIEIGSATYNGTTDELVIVANNTGASTLTLNNTDLLIDGELVSDWQTTVTVDGNTDRNLWAPQQTLEITVSRDTQPDRIKIVTEYAVAATATVEGS
ncbi:MAG: flagellin [Halovenus sp.]|uniref:flagellin n=1 Tax=Halovenus amylolytica TaxID=2500550 RepID=UPI000FE2F750